MSLRNVGRVTKAEFAREPRLMHVVAWYDGYGQAHGWKPTDHPRRLTADEGRCWREGWREGWREKVCHSWHGFIECPGDHPRRVRA